MDTTPLAEKGSNISGGQRQRIATLGLFYRILECLCWMATVLSILKLSVNYV